MGLSLRGVQAATMATAPPAPSRGRDLNPQPWDWALTRAGPGTGCSPSGGPGAGGASMGLRLRRLTAAMLWGTGRGSLTHPRGQSRVPSTSSCPAPSLRLSVCLPPSSLPSPRPHVAIAGPQVEGTLRTTSPSLVTNRSDAGEGGRRPSPQVAAPVGSLPCCSPSTHLPQPRSKEKRKTSQHFPQNILNWRQSQKTHLNLI